MSICGILKFFGPPIVIFLIVIIIISLLPPGAAEVMNAGVAAGQTIVKLDEALSN